MSSAKPATVQEPNGTLSPQEPSAEVAEELEPSGDSSVGVKEYSDVSNLEDEQDYEANILHLSDTEENEPYEDIIDEYGEDADFDFVVNSGDNFKLPRKVLNWQEEADGEHSPGDFDEELIDQYIEGYRSHFEGISEIGKQYSVEIGDLAGNHDPVVGTHKSDDSDAFKEAVNQRASEKFEDYEHENLRQYMLDTFDVIDLEGNSVDVNGIRIVGGLTGMETEAGEQFSEERDIDEFYSEGELEEIAGELSVERNYGWLEDIPVFGSLFGYLSDFNSEEVDADEIELGDIPEELRNEGHHNYSEARENALGEYNEKREAIEPMIEDFDGPVVIAGHQDMHVESEHGSKVFTDLAEEYDNVVGVLGGHTHGTEVYEHQGTVNVNSAETFSEVGVKGDEVHVDQHDNGSTAQSNGNLEEALAEVENNEQFQKMWGRHEEELESRIEQSDEEISKEEIQHVKEQQKRRMAAQFLQSQAGTAQNALA